MISYRFVDGTYRVETEIKHSRFITTVTGETDADGAESFIRTVRKKFPDATHNCYAYICGATGACARFSDDGEPGGTSGRPMLETLRKHGLTNTAVIVTRYFGGVKLGAGGLTSAYSGAVAQVLKTAVTSEKTECTEVEVITAYADLPAVENVIRNTGCVRVRAVYSETAAVLTAVPIKVTNEFVRAVQDASCGRASATVNGKINYYKMKSEGGITHEDHTC